MGSFVKMSGAVAAALVVSGTSLASATWSPFAGGDAGFSALTNNGSLERAVAEGRIGDNQTGGTWEQAIWEFGAVGTPVATAGQPAFTSGTGRNWSVSWDGVQTVSYTFGGETLTFNNVAGGFSDIFLRVRGTASSTATLSDINLDFAGPKTDLLIDPVASPLAGGAAYIRIENVGALPAFTLSGVSTFEWSGTRPNNSALAYQIKLTNVVPTPGAVAVAGLAGLAGLRRRRA